MKLRLAITISFFIFPLACRQIDTTVSATTDMKNLGIKLSPLSQGSDVDTETITPASTIAPDKIAVQIQELFESEHVSYWQELSVDGLKRFNQILSQVPPNPIKEDPTADIVREKYAKYEKILKDNPNLTDEEKAEIKKQIIGE